MPFYNSRTYTQVLVGSSIYWRGATCSAVFAVSLYDPTTATPLMHYDVTASPPVLWAGCQVYLFYIYGLSVAYLWLICGLSVASL